MPNHWLLKTEPSTYSFANLVREGRARWDGVSNPVALRHLRTMRKGDQALVYHTGKEKSIVGIAKIVSDPYPDPKLNDAKLVVVDLEPVAPVPKPVSLAAIKADKQFAGFDLVRIPRLSVVPVTGSQWKTLLTMGGR